MSPKQVARPSYAENLLTELDGIAEAYVAILARSAIKYVNPNTPDSPVFFVGAADYGWGDSDDALEADRMALLGKLRRWEPRFRLLFPNAIPTVQTRIKDDLKHLERWLIRPDRSDHSIPRTTDEAQALLTTTLDDIRSLFALLPADEYPVRLIVDTNALIDNPNLAAYIDTIGPKYIAHLLPVVLCELDDLKRAGRNDIVRTGAQRE
jgi:hypothetical protein